MKNNLKNLLAASKGILAADDSVKTIGRRFITVKIENNEENRRKFREMLFSTFDLEKYISGVILFKEAFEQKTDEGVLFTDLLKNRGIFYGIKLDEGLADFGEKSEKVTEGLDGLSERAAFFSEKGAVFSKWRAAFYIGDGMPSEECVEENVSRLAKYAKISQANNLIPIVEPEVLRRGEYLSEENFSVTGKILERLFFFLRKENVDLNNLLLKPNMIIAGDTSGEQKDSKKIGQLTAECCLKNVPKEVPGVVFLSGGQGEAEACENLNAVVLAGQNAPWKWTFSFDRALQNSALSVWSGKDENKEQAQNVFLERCRKASLASLGQYIGE